MSFHTEITSIFCRYYRVLSKCGHIGLAELCCVVSFVGQKLYETRLREIYPGSLGEICPKYERCGFTQEPKEICPKSFMAGKAHSPTPHPHPKNAVLDLGGKKI